MIVQCDRNWLDGLRLLNLQDLGCIRGRLYASDVKSGSLRPAEIEAPFLGLHSSGLHWLEVMHIQ